MLSAMATMAAQGNGTTAISLPLWRGVRCPALSIGCPWPLTRPLGENSQSLWALSPDRLRLTGRDSPHDTSRHFVWRGEGRRNPPLTAPFPLPSPPQSLQGPPQHRPLSSQGSGKPLQVQLQGVAWPTGVLSPNEH